MKKSLLAIGISTSLIFGGCAFSQPEESTVQEEKQMQEIKEKTVAIKKDVEEIKDMVGQKNGERVGYNLSRFSDFFVLIISDIERPIVLQLALDVDDNYRAEYDSVANVNTMVNADDFKLGNSDNKIVRVVEGNNVNYFVTMKDNGFSCKIESTKDKQPIVVKDIKWDKKENQQ
jgi:hypothetical protein